PFAADTSVMAFSLIAVRSTRLEARPPHATPPVVRSTPALRPGDEWSRNRRTPRTPTRSPDAQVEHRPADATPLGPDLPSPGTPRRRSPSHGTTTCRCVPGPSARPQPGSAG